MSVLGLVLRRRLKARVYSGFRTRYWELVHAGQKAKSLPGFGYAALYIGLKLNTVYHRVGLPLRLQLRLVPRRLWVSRRLMAQPYLVRVADILWGGRPSSDSPRVTGKGLGCGLILDGSWDTEDKRPLDEYLWSYVYSRSTLQIVRDRLPYTDTDQYTEMASVVRAGSFQDWRARGCRSEEDIRRYFAQIEDTFRSIRERGYMAQAALGSKRWYDEIKVFVDRNGELHKQQGGGHHRLAMARTLHVDRVPVLIIGVHRQWAEAAQREFGKDLITSVDLRIRRDIACR